MFKKLIIFICALALCVLCFSVPVIAADVVYLDSEIYGFDKTLTERAQTTTGGKTYQGYIITADDECTLYYIGCNNSSSFLNATSSAGVYNGHSYILYSATSNYARFSVQTADIGSANYSGLSWYSYIIFGDDYIRQNIGALADKLGVTSSYTYGGSAMIVNAGLSGSSGVQSFFPKTPVSVLTKVVKAPTVQGVLTEVVALLPVLIPSLIFFIALRKGLTFKMQTLKSC